MPSLVEIGPNDFKMLSMYFCYFVNIRIPKEKGGTLHLYKLKFSSPKETLCLVWLKLAQWFFKFHHGIFAIS